MGLIAALLGFVLRKGGAFLAMVLSLFLGYLLIQALVPSLREAVADQGRLERVAQERADLEEKVERLQVAAADEQSEAVATLAERTEEAVEEGRSRVASKRSEIDDLRDDEREICDLVRKLIDLITPGSACDAAREAVEKADSALDTIEGSLVQAQAQAAILDDPDLTEEQKLDRLGQGGDPADQGELAVAEAELDQKMAEEESLQQARASGSGWVVYQWSRTWQWLVLLALLVLLLPVIARVVSYFVLMPTVSRIHKPIHLAEGGDVPAANLHFAAAQRSIAVELGDGDVLSARSEHLRPVQGQVRSTLLYDRRAPFVSFAAGLWELSRVTGDEHGTSATLSTPNDPDSYLMRVDFTDHPGLMMRPKYVVGVIGKPRLQTRWRWGVQALARWQVRYILFTGSGSLIVQGKGDVVADSPGGKSTRMDQNLVMGFDSRLKVGVRRTEAFWPYLRGRKPLIDDEFTGPQGSFFWQKSNEDGPSNPIARVFNAFFSAFGKLLGF